MALIAEYFSSSTNKIRVEVIVMVRAESIPFTIPREILNCSVPVDNEIDVLRLFDGSVLGEDCFEIEDILAVVGPDADESFAGNVLQALGCHFFRMNLVNFLSGFKVIGLIAFVWKICFWALGESLSL
jgi:hypothetical protein